MEDRMDPAAAPLEELALRAQSEYRRLAGQWLPELLAQGRALAAKEAAFAPALETLAQLEAKLASHMRREEEHLFPALLQLAAAPEPSGSGPACSTAPCRFCTVGHVLFMFEQDHEALNALAAELRQKSAEPEADSEWPEQARRFADELGALLRLENDNLFWRAIQRERLLKGLEPLR